MKYEKRAHGYPDDDIVEIEPQSVYRGRQLGPIGMAYVGRQAGVLALVSQSNLEGPMIAERITMPDAYTSGHASGTQPLPEA